MAVHRLTKPEQHLPSFALHRTFIRKKKKKSVTGKRWYFLMWERCNVKIYDWWDFSKAPGEMGTSRAWGGRLPRAHLVLGQSESSLTVCGDYISPLWVSLWVLLLRGWQSLLPTAQGLISTHYPDTQLVCRNAYLSREMRNGEGRKNVFVYSTCSLKILGPLPVMLYLIPISFFPPQC